MRGTPLSPAVVDSLVTLLEQPVAAAVIGVALGVGLLFLSRKGFTGVTADEPLRGVVLAGLAMLARLVGSVLLLWGYKSLAPAGFVPFAISFAGGFLLMYTVELVRFAGLHRYARPARTGVGR